MGLLDGNLDGIDVYLEHKERLDQQHNDSEIPERIGIMGDQVALAVQPLDASVIEQVIIKGDLANLTPTERVNYYQSVCNSLGLNPLTKPFDYIVLNKKLTLYAKRDAAEQLRKRDNISVNITGREQTNDCYIVTAKARTPEGREDESTGVVNVANLKGDALANAMMKAECVPLDSEILTKDGFKRYNELNIGEAVLAYDVESDECKWTPLLDLTIHDNLPMGLLHTEKNEFNVLCTTAHTWAVQRSKPYELDKRGNGSHVPRGPYKNRGPLRSLERVEQIKTSHRLILAAPETQIVESLLTPQEAGILGWIVTDGTIQKRGNSVRLGICQSKPENFETIRKLVDSVAPGTKEVISPARERTFPGGRTYATREQHWWYLGAEISRSLLNKAEFSGRHDLPQIVTKLSHDARVAMLAAMMQADGDKRNVFANSDVHILEAIQILCALEGKATDQPHQKNSVKTIKVRSHRFVAGRNLTFALGDQEPAWCPTTRFGTWVMRQGGRVMITGNTKAKRRVTLSIVGLGWLDETEIETIPSARVANIDGETGEIIDSNATTNGNGTGDPPDRPWPPEFLAHVMGKKIERHKATGPITANQLALVAGKLNEVWPGDPEANNNRRSVLKYLFDVDSAKDLACAQAAVILDWLIEEKDETNDYPLKPMAEREAKLIVRQFMEDARQLVLDIDEEDETKGGG